MDPRKADGQADVDAWLQGMLNRHAPSEALKACPTDAGPGRVELFVEFETIPGGQVSSARHVTVKPLRSIAPHARCVAAALQRIFAGETPPAAAREGRLIILGAPRTP